ncbi:hypothetical protein MNBD_ALPHA12-275 [hydrothermal vent metagenome]|uniref:Uncharacterized protein n=1 Tax=hydrothermal vent metagenome TaxID=652676 RepID=A0A3B0U5U5_9ZZZZ
MVASAVWSGQTGTEYLFRLYPVGTEFRPVSGVYIFCRPVGKTGMEALYVGDTQSFYDCLNTGCEDQDGFESALRAGATHIGLMRVDYSTDRLRIETDLRHGLNPRCNTQPVNAMADELLHK